MKFEDIKVGKLYSRESDSPILSTLLFYVTKKSKVDVYGLMAYYNNTVGILKCYFTSIREKNFGPEYGAGSYIPHLKVDSNKKLIIYIFRGSTKKIER